MKVYSDTITRDNLHYCTPASTYIYDLKEAQRPIKRRHSYTVILASELETRRRSNSGGYGAGDHRAPTWDEYGLWIDALFAIDPDAVIGPYDGRDDFYRQTEAFVTSPWFTMQYGNRPHVQYAREHSAPWLERVTA